MADIEEAVMTHLLAQTGLTALIDRRIFYDVLPQNTDLPAAVIINISDVKDHTHQGIDDLESPNYQITVYATKRSETKAIAAQVKTALSDYSGTMSGLQVPYIALITELAGHESNSDGTINLYTHDLEFNINYYRQE